MCGAQARLTWGKTGSNRLRDGFKIETCAEILGTENRIKNSIGYQKPWTIITVFTPLSEFQLNDLIGS